MKQYFDLRIISPKDGISELALKNISKHEHISTQQLGDEDADE